jgi:hypothetical protein
LGGEKYTRKKNITTAVFSWFNHNFETSFKQFKFVACSLGFVMSPIWQEICCSHTNNY